MKKLLLTAIITITTGCASMTHTQHESSGHLLPKKLDDLQLITTTEFNETSRSSSASYRSPTTTSTVYFRDADISKTDYYDVSKQGLAVTVPFDTTLYEGTATVTIKGEDIEGQVLRVYDSNNAAKSKDITMTYVSSIGVWEIDDALVKVRTTKFGLLGPGATDSTLELIQDTENAILTGIFDQPEAAENK